MTTLKDLIGDFQKETILVKERVYEGKMGLTGVELARAEQDVYDELLDELVETIKERWVG